MLTIVTLLVLTGLFEKLPEATLAAVVIAAVVELVDIASLRRLYAVWTRRLGSIYGHAARADFAAAIAAMLGVLIFDTLPGLVIGIGVSILLLLYRASRPNVAALARHGRVWVDRARHPELPVAPDVVVARVEGGLFFADADYVKQRLAALCSQRTRVLILDAETSPIVDVTAAGMLAELHRDLSRRSIELRIARDVGQFRDVLSRAQVGDERVAVYPTVSAALAEPDHREAGQP